MKSPTFLRLAAEEVLYPGEQDLTAFFSDADPVESLATLIFFSGKPGKPPVSPAALKKNLPRIAGYPSWLIQDSAELTKNLTELVAALTSGQSASSGIPAREIFTWFSGEPGNGALFPENLLNLLSRADRIEREILLGLLTGQFVSPFHKPEVVLAFCRVHGYHPFPVSRRLSGFSFREDPETFLVLQELTGSPFRIPFPEFQDSFSSTEPGVAAEVIPDGTECMLVRTATEFLAAGREFMALNLSHNSIHQSFPADSVFTGWSVPELPAKRPVEKPVVVLSDCLMWKGDLLDQTEFSVRRRLIEQVLENHLPDGNFSLSDVYDGLTPDQVGDLIRQPEFKSASGFRIRRKTGFNGFFLKPEGGTFIAGALYVQTNGAADPSVYTWTVGVRQGLTFVPAGKAHFRFSPEDEGWVNGFIKQNTIEKTGPVRVLKPGLVFGMSYGRTVASTRHKAGFKLEGLKIMTLCRDKTWGEITEADRLKPV